MSFLERKPGLALGGRLVIDPDLRRRRVADGYVREVGGFDRRVVEGDSATVWWTSTWGGCDLECLFCLGHQLVDQWLDGFVSTVDSRVGSNVICN